MIQCLDLFFQLSEAVAEFLHLSFLFLLNLTNEAVCLYRNYDYQLFDSQSESRFDNCCSSANYNRMDVRPQVECFVSPFLIDEASRGDAAYAQKRLDEIVEFTVLDVNEEIEDLAQQYFAALQIPEKAKIDAFHLAVAAWHKMDYLLSWNCKHIASGRVQKMMQEINARLKVHTPIVCTPEELMEV